MDIREPDDIYMAKEFPGMAEMPNEKILSEGKAIQKVQTEFTTAISVQRPRDIDKIQKSVLREAEYAGEDFFYSWTVKTKKGPQIIQGPSIGLAMCVAREWTNCAVDVQVEPGRIFDIFTACFIDIEKGFTVKRVFKQKRGIAPGRYDADRWEDMEFQKGQSKAIRSVVVSGVPRWLVNQAMDKAKDAELKNITKEGIDAATQKALKFFERYDVSEQQVIKKMGKPRNEWINEDILILRGYASEIKDGQASAKELFPQVDEVAPIPKEEKKKKTDKQESSSDNEEVVTSETINVGPETLDEKALYREEWVNLRSAGYSTYIHRNFARIKKNAERWPDLYTEQKEKWWKLYPNDPWQLVEKAGNQKGEYISDIPCPINENILTDVIYCRDSCTHTKDCQPYQEWKYNND
jgi:hypothetical protein